MKKIFFCLAACAFLAPSAFGAEVLAVFKNETGVRLTAASIRAATPAHVVAAAASVGAAVKARYAALSEAQGKGTFVLLRSDTQTERELIEALKGRPDVLAVSPNYRFELAATPSDPSYNQLWGLQAVGAPAAWDTITGSSSVYVAVLDSGIAYGHEDLGGNFEGNGYSRNFSGNTSGDSDYADYNGHGSHVAGIIGAVGNNGVGVTGVNWRTKLISARAFDSSGSSQSDLSEVAAAVDYLVELLNLNPSLNLAAVNMSFRTYTDTPPSGMTSDVFYQIMKTLNDLNRPLIITAAGNEGQEVGVEGTGTYAGKYVYPASFEGLDNMLVVAAVNSRLSIATNSDFTGGSNYSASKVHLGAPGVGILSTVLNGYGSMSGTSMATPYVTGAAALLRSQYPDATTAELKTALFEGATSQGALASYVAGGRLLNIEGALEVLSSNVAFPTNAAAVPINEDKSAKTGSSYSSIVVQLSEDEPQVGDVFYIWLEKSSDASTRVRYWTEVKTAGQLDIVISDLKAMSEAAVAASIGAGTYNITYESEDGLFTGKVENVPLAGAGSDSSKSGGGGGCDALGMGMLLLLACWLPVSRRHPV